MPNTLLSRSDPKSILKSGDLLFSGPVLLIGDHAGAAIPVLLGDLGLAVADRQRHIALDIGVEHLGLRLGELLGAPFLRQAFSRLVIDCNRSPEREDAVAPVSDGTPVPGNTGLTDITRQARVAEIHEPYHAAISEALDAREAAGLQTILVSLHSFTPVLAGLVRPWHIGVLHDRGDGRFAQRMLAWTSGRGAFVVADNQPYAMDGTDYTVPRHAYPRSLPYVELEVRQDLVGPKPDARFEEVAAFLAAALEECARD